MPRPRRLKSRFRAPQRPDLTIEQILVWCDAFMARVGRWPTRRDGGRGLADTTWSAVDACLKTGRRGLKPGSSLAQLLLDRRGRRHKGRLPRLTVPQILTWADAHHAHTGEWPHEDSGPVAGAPGETWVGVDTALFKGGRGLSGGSSLPQLLAARRGVRNHLALPPLTAEQILAWADAHHTRTGAWPHRDSGRITGVPTESWSGVNTALCRGTRGLPGGSSLAQLLHAERGVENWTVRPALRCWEILFWADAHHTRTGRWPTTKSGPIPESVGDTWATVDSALRDGLRGLSGGDSLARLLHRRSGVPNARTRPPLSTEQILEWADAHRRRSGNWPTRESGAISGVPGETWRAVHGALQRGCRGLSGGSSLAQLLAAERGVRNCSAAPALTCEQILRWADAHRSRAGRWPTSTSGAVIDSPQETWLALNAALGTGVRGLPGGSSLARLLAEHRGKRNHLALPPLTVCQILAWADDHRAHVGRWPSTKSGEIPKAPGQTWAAVDAALREGARGQAQRHCRPRS
jgi:hypothetical protein